jgi:hypothetical protein
LSGGWFIRKCTFPIRVLGFEAAQSAGGLLRFSLHKNPPTCIALVNIKTGTEPGVLRDVEDHALIWNLKVGLAVKVLNPFLTFALRNGSDKLGNLGRGPLICGIETLRT